MHWQQKGCQTLGHTHRCLCRQAFQNSAKDWRSSRSPANRLRFVMIDNQPPARPYLVVQRRDRLLWHRCVLNYAKAHNDVELLGREWENKYIRLSNSVSFGGG